MDSENLYVFRSKKKLIFPKQFQPLNSPGQLFFDGDPEFESKLEEIVGLDRIDIRLLTSLSAVFSYNPNLSKLDGIQNWDVSKCKNFSSMFQSFPFSRQYIPNGGPYWDFSNWDMRSAENIDHMFSFNRAYSFGDLGKWNLENIKSITGLFDTSKNLRSVGDLSNWNIGSNITSLEGVFRRTTGLISVGNINKWDVSNCTSLKNTFEDSGITDLVLDDWDTSSCTNMESTFAYCMTKNLNLSKWNTGRVKTFEKMFAGYGYKGVENVGDLSGWNTSSVTSIKDMFESSRIAIKNANIADWDMSSCADMSFAFMQVGNHKVTTTEVILRWNTPSLRTANAMFLQAGSIETIDISTFTLNNLSSSNGVNMLFCNCGKLKTLKLGKFDLAWREDENDERHPITPSAAKRMFYEDKLLSDIYLDSDADNGFNFLKQQLVFEKVASHCKIHKGDEVYFYDGKEWKKEV